MKPGNSRSNSLSAIVSGKEKEKERKKKKILRWDSRARDARVRRLDLRSVSGNYGKLREFSPLGVKKKKRINLIDDDRTNFEISSESIVFIIRYTIASRTLVNDSQFNFPTRLNIAFSYRRYRTLERALIIETEEETTEIYIFLREKKTRVDNWRLDNYLR